MHGIDCIAIVYDCQVDDSQSTFEIKIPKKLQVRHYVSYDTFQRSLIVP